MKTSEEVVDSAFGRLDDAIVSMDERLDDMIMDSEFLHKLAMLQIKSLIVVKSLLKEPGALETLARFTNTKALLGALHEWEVCLLDHKEEMMGRI